MEAEVRPDGDLDGRAAEHGGPPRSSAQARAMARRRLCGFDSRVVDDCLLVVSELVTNALRHGGGLVDFRVATPPGRVTVTVEDRSSALPMASRHSVGLLPGGYGWPLVCRLARQITINLWQNGGKSIHVSLAR